jgi:hypothetical protein
MKATQPPAHFHRNPPGWAFDRLFVADQSKSTAGIVELLEQRGRIGRSLPVVNAESAVIQTRYKILRFLS